MSRLRHEGQHRLVLQQTGENKASNRTEGMFIYEERKNEIYLRTKQQANRGEISYSMYDQSVPNDTMRCPCVEVRTGRDGGARVIRTVRGRKEGVAKEEYAQEPKPGRRGTGRANTGTQGRRGRKEVSRSDAFPVRPEPEHPFRAEDELIIAS